MDGFDDLLAPSSSRNVLEENPFEDPFAKRSSSPDPWSNFLKQSEPEPTHNDYRTGFEDEPERNTSPTPTTESYVTGDRGHSEQSSTVDPLDAAAVTAEDHDDEATNAISSRTPGFRISTYSVEEHITTVSEDKSDPPAHDDEKVVKAAATPPHPVPSPSPTTLPSTEVVTSHTSHLEQSFLPPVDQSFANITVGGDSHRGWQADWGANDQLSPIHSPVVNTTAEDEDDDDDKPIGQSAKFKDRIDSPQVSTRTRIMIQLPTAQQVASSPGSDSSPSLFVISVDDPQRVGDPIRSFTMYTVHTRVSRFLFRAANQITYMAYQTTSPLYQKSVFSVLRRYSDFLWLYETLSMNNPGVVVPPAPGKNPFGRFDETFVQQRRMALEKCIQKIANHPVLAKDPDLKLFLESDTFSLDVRHMIFQFGFSLASCRSSIGKLRYHTKEED